MKIGVKTSEGRAINIPVPMSLALAIIKNGALKAGKKSAKDVKNIGAIVGAGMAFNGAEDAEDEDIPAGDDPSGADREDVKKLVSGLKEAKKVWGHLKIVEIISSDGEELTITL